MSGEKPRTHLVSRRFQRALGQEIGNREFQQEILGNSGGLVCRVQLRVNYKTGKHLASKMPQTSPIPVLSYLLSDLLFNSFSALLGTAEYLVPVGCFPGAYNLTSQWD